MGGEGREREGDYRPAAREALRGLLEGQVQVEVDEHVGAGRCERQGERRGYRNGHYTRHLLTQLGDIVLRVPRTRKGSYQWRVLARYARREGWVDQVLLACFCLGLSTRKAAEVLAPMVGETVSASTVSRIAQGLDQAVGEYHRRGLTDRYRHLFFDGVVLRSKGAAKVQKKILLCAFGITHDGIEEMGVRDCMRLCRSFTPRSPTNGAQFSGFTPWEMTILVSMALWSHSDPSRPRL